MSAMNFESQNALKSIVEPPIAIESSSKGEDSPSQIMVQVPAKELQSLQKENSQLRKKNQCLNRFFDLSSALFGLFSELPVEIRVTIWEFALRAPQIHLIIQKRDGKSTVNNVMQSCKEARDYGLLLKLPYYKLRSRTSYKQGRSLEFANGRNRGSRATPLSRDNGFRVHRFPIPPDSPKYYMNPDVDTILFTRFENDPSWVYFFCGLEECAAPDAKYSRSHFHSHCEHRIAWPKLALCYDVDEDLNQPSTSMTVKNLGAIVELGVRELLGVIGDTNHCATHNVGFIAPRTKFRHTGRRKIGLGKSEVQSQSWVDRFQADCF